MKKNKGFIATSLIYSFFLVFIAVMAALLRIYLSNKTILERFNSDATQELNTSVYKVDIISKGSENFSIQINENNEEKVLTQGQTLTNLIYDGQFSNKNERWEDHGTITSTLKSIVNGRQCLSIDNASAGSYVFQDSIYTIQNNVYYYSIEYSQNIDSQLKVYMNSSMENTIITSNTQTNWNRKSQVFRETNETGTNKTFIVGLSDINYSGAYFTNAMLLDLTDHYGAGREPNSVWLDRNIDYFEGSVNYLRETQIFKGSDLIIKMVTTKDEEGYNNAIVNCNGKNNNWNNSNIDLKLEEYNATTFDGKIVKRYRGYLTLKNISDDIKCSIEWVKNNDQK